MSEATNGPGARPWTLRAIESLPFSPAWAGFALASAVGLLGVGYLLAMRAVSGTEPETGLFLAELFLAAQIGYAPAAAAYAAKATVRDLRDLEPALDLAPADVAERRRELESSSGAGLRGACLGAAALGAFGSLVGLAGLETSGLARLLGIGRPWGDPLLPWAVLRNATLLFMLAQLAWIDVVGARRLGALGRSVRVDLLGLAPLRPCTTGSDGRSERRSSARGL